MQVKHWLPPVILLGAAGLALWSTQRLIHGKPRWNSLFGIGHDHSRGMPPAPGFLPPGRGERHRDSAQPRTGPPGGPAQPRTGPPAGPAQPRTGPPAGPMEPDRAAPANRSGSWAVAGNRRRPVPLSPGAGPWYGGPGESVIDPVCGAPGHSRAGVSVRYNGRLVHFCSGACLDAFRQRPQHYMPR